MRGPGINDVLDAATAAAEARRDAASFEEQRRLIKLAQDADAQLASPVVQIVLAQAGEEASKAFDEFLACDPHDVALVKSIQWRAARALTVAGWLREVIDGGTARDGELREAGYAENQLEE